jgi:N-acetylmuramic acid 6-phosphate etherase
MKIDLLKLATEKRNEKSMAIDIASPLEIVSLMNQEDNNIIKGIEKEVEAISKVVEVTAKQLSEGGRLFYIGAGTSGRLGVLDAVECPPTFGTNPDLVVGLIAGGEKAFVKAVEGAEDSKELAIEDLKASNLTDKDVVVGIAASGRTPYVIGGLEYANEVGAVTASIAITYNSEVGKYATYPIEVEVGAEVLTGSTRLKAGTAQKMILNMISTGSMILNGKAYENLMVDMTPTNEKLVQRAVNIVVQATGCEASLAEEKLALSNGNSKEAIVMIIHNVEYDEALQLLKDANGFIRKIQK